MIIVSRQYTMKTPFGFQPRNHTPITGRRFGTIMKKSDSLSALLNIFEITWRLFEGKVAKFDDQLNNH